jgi:hypothetical protein
MTKLHEASNIVIEYDTAESWIYSEWIGPQSESDIRGGGHAMISAMRKMNAKYGCTRVLNDNRKVASVWGHSVDWAAKEWLPAMNAAGLKSFAWILSPQATINMSGLRMRLRAGPEVDEYMWTFGDAEEAKAWLRSRGTGP